MLVAIVAESAISKIQKNPNHMKTLAFCCAMKELSAYFARKNLCKKLSFERITVYLLPKYRLINYELYYTINQLYSGRRLTVQVLEGKIMDKIDAGMIIKLSGKYCHEPDTKNI